MFPPLKFISKMKGGGSSCSEDCRVLNPRKSHGLYVRSMKESLDYQVDSLDLPHTVKNVHNT